MISKLVWLIALGFVLAACGAATEVASDEPSEQAVGYLSSVAEIQGRIDDGFSAVDDALGRSYPTREVLLSSIKAVGYEGLAATTLSLAGNLTPPSEYETEHERWLAHRRLATEESERLAEVIEAGDLQGVFAVFGRLGQDFGELLGSSSRTFCLAVADNETEMCPADADLAGGDYGAEVYEILRENRLSNLGLFDFFNDMSPDEVALRLDEVQPYIEANLKSAGDALKGIDPPSEYESGHEALVTFFDDQYATAIAITEANAARDNSRITELFAKSGVVLQTASSALSPEYREIAAPLFGPEDG